MTKKFTIEEVLIFRTNANRHIDGKPRNKFTYALEKMISRTNFVQKLIEEFNNDLLTEHASVDDRGNIIYQDDKMVFKPEAKKKIDKVLREKVKDVVEVELYEASEVPTDLRADWEDILLPFVTLPKLEANKEEKAA
jgi:hypothetical protein